MSMCFSKDLSSLFKTIPVCGDAAHEFMDIVYVRKSNRTSDSLDLWSKRTRQPQLVMKTVRAADSCFISLRVKSNAQIFSLW